MPYFVGVIVPGSGVSVPAGYELDALARQQITLGVRGVPISVQHAGVRDAVSDVLQRGRSLCNAAELRGSLRHVGVVRYGWMASDGAIWVMFDIFSDCDLVLWLIHHGHLQALSLSHVGESTPVEVSLCSVPARDFCFVRAAFPTLRGAFAYKAEVDRGVYTSVNPTAMTDATTAAAAPALTPLEQALALLPDAERGLVMARFTEMLGKVDDARADSASSAKRLEQMTAIKETDKKMFTEQFSYLLDFLPDAKKYAVTGETCSVLQEASPEVLHHVGQLVKCASARLAASAIASSSAVREAPSLKRVRTETTPVAEQVPTSSQALLSPLGRALAATFN